MLSLGNSPLCEGGKKNGKFDGGDGDRRNYELQGRSERLGPLVEAKDILRLVVKSRELKSDRVPTDLPNRDKKSKDRIKFHEKLITESSLPKLSNLNLASKLPSRYHTKQKGSFGNQLSLQQSTIFSSNPDTQHPPPQKPLIQASNHAPLFPYLQSNHSIIHCNDSRYRSRLIVSSEPNVWEWKGGGIRAGGSFTHAGTRRNYNEDRLDHVISGDSVGIGIFDGHGGSLACEYIVSQEYTRGIVERVAMGMDKEELHQSIISYHEEFDRGLEAIQTPANDESGTCSLVLVSTKDKLLAVHVGDCRLVGSFNKEVIDLTNDHRPTFAEEAERISKNGGKIYRDPSRKTKSLKGKMAMLVGDSRAMRVSPGDLSVSRTFGDHKAKKLCPGVITCIPDIVEIPSDFDYLLMGTDGVFDTISNHDIDAIVNKYRNGDAKQAALKICKSILQSLLIRGCTDNVSCVFIVGNKWL